MPQIRPFWVSSREMDVTLRTESGGLTGLDLKFWRESSLQHSKAVNAKQKMSDVVMKAPPGWRRT